MFLFLFYGSIYGQLLYKSYDCTLDNHALFLVTVATNGKALAAGTSSGKICIWNSDTGALSSIYLATKYVNSVFIDTSDIRNTMYYGTDDYNAYKLDISSILTPSLTQTFVGHTNYIQAVLASGSILFTGSWDTTAIQWNANTGQLIRRFIGHSNVIYSLCFDGINLYTGSSDTTIKKWYLSITDAVATFWGHSLTVRVIYFYQGFLFSVIIFLV